VAPYVEPYVEPIIGGLQAFGAGTTLPLAGIGAALEEASKPGRTMERALNLFRPEEEQVEIPENYVWNRYLDKAARTAAELGLDPLKTPETVGEVLSALRAAPQAGGLTRELIQPGDPRLYTPEERMAGRLIEFSGDILGDPSTYTPAGLAGLPGKLRRVAQAERLGEAVRVARQVAPGIAEDLIGTAFPGLLAQAPGLITAAPEQAEASWQAFQEGRYPEAAEAGLETLLGVAAPLMMVKGATAEGRGLAEGTRLSRLPTEAVADSFLEQAGKAEAGKGRARERAAEKAELARAELATRGDVDALIEQRLAENAARAEVERGAPPVEEPPPALAERPPEEALPVPEEALPMARAAEEVAPYRAPEEREAEPAAVREEGAPYAEKAPAPPRPREGEVAVYGPRVSVEERGELRALGEVPLERLTQDRAGQKRLQELQEKAQRDAPKRAAPPIRTLPTDSIPDSTLQRQAEDHVLKRIADPDIPLPEALRPYETEVTQLYDAAADTAAGARTELQKFRESYGAQARLLTNGVYPIKGAGGWERLIQVHNGEVIGGALGLRGKTEYIVGGELFGSPVSIGPLYREMRRRWDADKIVSPLGELARRRFEEKGARATVGKGVASEYQEGYRVPAIERGHLPQPVREAVRAGREKPGGQEALRRGEEVLRREGPRVRGVAERVAPGREGAVEEAIPREAAPAPRERAGPGPEVALGERPAGEGIPAVRGLVGDYVKSRDIAPLPEFAAHDEARAKKIADAYEAMQHEPNAPEVRVSYEALKKDVADQYQYLKDQGYTLEPWTKEGQPYKNSAEMKKDVQDNKHLYFFTGGDMPADHPLAGTDSRSGLAYNDMLRAVHDVFGHAKEGFQFGARGEEFAWREHMAMFSPEARPALTTETRGQNSWVNFGAHLRADGHVPKKGEPGYIPPEARPFAEQKAGLLPAEFVRQRAERYGPPPKTREEAVTQARAATNEPRPPARSISGVDAGSGVRTLGKGINAELREKGWVDLRGRQARNVDEVAQIAQVFRDPRYETFRIVATKDGKVVGDMGYSSRLPSAAQVIDPKKAAQNLHEMSRWLDRVEADDYYMIHNHPGGDPSPTHEDLAMTQRLAGSFRGETPGLERIKTKARFQGHVVIDSGKYAVIGTPAPRGVVVREPGGRERFVGMEVRDLPGWGGEDKLLQSEMAHGLIGVKVQQPTDVARYARLVHNDPNMVTLLYTGAPGTVRGIQQMPANLFKNVKEAGKYIRARQSEFGAGSTFAYHADDADLGAAARDLYRTRVLRDSIREQRQARAVSLYEEEGAVRPTPYEPLPRYRVREEAPVYEKEAVEKELPPEFLQAHAREHGAAPMTVDELQGAVPRIYEQHPERPAFEAAIRALRPDVKPRMMENLWDLAQYQKGVTGKEEFNFLQKVGDRVVGAPERVKDAASLKKFLGNLEKQANDGKIGRHWYERSSEAILRLTQGDKVEAEKLAQLIAIYSPSNPVPANWVDALQAYNTYRRLGKAEGLRRIEKGERVIGAGMYGRQDRTAESLLFKDEGWRGAKTNNFYRNLMTVIDPEGVGSPENLGVTVDMHIMRAMGYPSISPSLKQYIWADNAFREVAKRQGWKPWQTQAAVWTTQKYGPNAPESLDFSHAAQSNVGRIALEAVPHPSTGHPLAALEGKSYESRRQYTDEIHEALNPDGKDPIAQAAGVLRVDSIKGPGMYEGQANPGFQIMVEAVPGQGSRKGPDAFVDPAGLENIRDAAAGYGHLLRQDSVGILRPFYIERKLDNGYEVRTGAVPSVEQMKAFEGAMPDHMKGPNSGIVYTYGPRGLHAINLTTESWWDGPKIKVGDFQKAVSAAADGLVKKGVIKEEASLVSFKNYSELVGKGDYEDRIRNPGRPDLQRAVDAARTRIEAVNQRWTERLERGEVREPEAPYGARPEEVVREREPAAPGAAETAAPPRPAAPEAEAARPPPDWHRTGEGEPPVPAGKVRIYNGGDSRWFTESREVAEDFAHEAAEAGRPGSIRFLDVSPEQVRRFGDVAERTRAAIPAEGALVVPRKVAEGATPLFRWPAAEEEGIVREEAAPYGAPRAEKKERAPSIERLPPARQTDVSGFITPRGRTRGIVGDRSHAEAAGGERALTTAINRGYVRWTRAGLDFGEGSSLNFELGTKPSVASERAIRELVEGHRGDIFIDLYDGKRRTDIYYPAETNPTKVVGDVRRFYAGEDIGRVREEEAPYGAPARPAAEDLSPLGFYSNLQRAAAKLPQVLRGEQAVQYFAKQKRKVTRDEMRWTGLLEYLKERGRERVTPKEIQDYVRAHEIRVDEVRRGPTVIRGQPGPTTAKFGQHTLPGGENYREVVLMLPQREAPFPTYEEWLRTEITPDMRGKEQEAANRRVYESDKRRAGYAAAQAGFRGGHYEEPNVLAHLRLNDRVDADGKKVLFIEEVQSDWAQKGRREGFEKERPAKLEARQSEDGDYWSVVNATTGERISTREFQTEAQARTAATMAMREMGELPSKIPRAPFVTKTEDWTDLAMKRVLRLAAEGGYDRVAWTTGEQQNARYDLRKQVDRIAWNADSNFLKGWKKGESVLTQEGVTKEKLADWIGKDAADKLIQRGPERRGEGQQDVRYLEGVDLAVGGAGMKGFYDEIVPQRMNKLGRQWGTKVGKTKIETPSRLDEWQYRYDGPSLTPDEMMRKIPEWKKGYKVPAAQIDQAARLTNAVIDGASFEEAMLREGSPALAELVGGKMTRIDQPKLQAQQSIDITPQMRDSVKEQGFAVMEEKAPYGAPTGPTLYGAEQPAGTRATGRPPEVEREVSQLSRAAGAAGQMPPDLDRNTAEHWDDYDPQIKDTLRTWKDEDFVNRVRQNKQLKPHEVQALKARVQSRWEIAQNNAAQMEVVRKSGGDVAKANSEYLRSMLDYIALERANVNDGTSAARALAARGRVMEAGAIADNTMRKILRELPDITDRQATELFNAIRTDPERAIELVRGFVKPPSWRQKIAEFYRANLLTLTSDVANLAGNAAEQTARLGETAIGGAIEKTLETLAILPKEGRRQGLSETAAEIRGAQSVFWPAFKEFLSEARNPFGYEALDLGRKFDIQPGAIGGKFGRLIRWPFRRLGAADRLFKAVGGEAELYKLATREARKELGPRATPAQLKKRFEDILRATRDPESDAYSHLIKQVEESKEDRTFQNVNRLATMAKAVDRFDPLVGALTLPFKTTPSNIAWKAIQRSPAGFGEAFVTWRRFRKGLATRDQVVDAFARPALGSALLGGFYMLASSGTDSPVGMTGSGPTDEKEKNLLLDTGWQPYSFVIRGPGGPHYIPYSRLEPLSSTLGIAADFAEAESAEKRGALMDKFLGSIAQNFTNKTYLKGLADAAEVITDPGRSASTWLSSTIASLAVPGQIAKLTQALDPYVRDTTPTETGIAGTPERIAKKTLARIPVVSETLPKRLGPTGEPIERPSMFPGSRVFMPVQVTAAKPGKEVEKLLVRVGYVPGVPSHDVKYRGMEVRLADDAYELLRQADRDAAEKIRRMMNQPGFQSLPDTESEGGKRSKEYLIKDAYRDARARARRRAFQMRSTQDQLYKLRSNRRNVTQSATSEAYQ
jgi:hypothetical protein